jgi:hypothetical protein
VNNDTFQPVNNDTFKPVNNDTFKPVNNDAFKPVNNDTFKPVNNDTFKPMNNDTFKPMNNDAFQPVNNDIFQHAFLAAVRDKIPLAANPANILMDILFIGKEAIYRRLRGEVPFTFLEIAIIANELSISLDTIIGCDSEKSRPFQIRLIEYADPKEFDFALLQGYAELLDTGRSDPCSELTMATNSLPQTIYTKYDCLFRFFVFKWFYHHENGPVKPFGEIAFSEKLKDIQIKSGLAHMQIKTTNYIFDNLLLFYVVNDIKYFAKIGLIPESDVLELKKELREMLGYLETLAATACFETGNNVNVYVSNINMESTYTCVKVHHSRLSLINAFVLNSAVSVDQKIFEKTEKWLSSIKRLSTLISQSGELQRIRFFKEQRDIVNTL